MYEWVRVQKLASFFQKISGHQMILSGNKCQLCLVFVSCVHRRVVEGYGVGSAECVVYVDVHGE